MFVHHMYSQTISTVVYLDEFIRCCCFEVELLQFQFNGFQLFIGFKNLNKYSLKRCYKNVGILFFDHF